MGVNIFNDTLFRDDETMALFRYPPCGSGCGVELVNEEECAPSSL